MIISKKILIYTIFFFFYNENINMKYEYIMYVLAIF